MLKYLSIALTVCALFGFVYGLVRFVRKRRALYTLMIVFGIGCAMMGRLFETLQLVASGEVHNGFQIGVLGVVGSFLFFFTANYGQMDSLVDDGSRAFLKYRIIAMLAPICMVVFYVVYFSYVGFGENAIVRAVETIIIAMASYFHLKHLIIKDVDYGIISCIRMYNLLALLYAFLCMGEMILTTAPFSEIYTIVLYAAMCIIMLIFIPVLERGVRKWTI